MPTFNAKLALSSRSCSEKAPFVVHKITIDYAFDQVFKPKMLSLHENITPQILTFMHELPFFPSYFVWNPFCFCRGFLLFFVVDAFVYIPSFFLFFSFLLCSFNFLPRNPKNMGVFSEKVHRFFENLHRFSVKVHRFLEATL